MFDELKRIFRHSLAYGLGPLLSSAIAFLMIPVYTRYLTAGDYGVLELVGHVVTVTGMVLGAGFSEAVLRFYFEEQDEAGCQRVVSTGLLYTLGVAGIATLILVALAAPLSRGILGQTGYVKLLQIALLCNFLDMLAIICLTYLRAIERSGLYSAILVSKLILQLGLNIALVVGFRMGVMGIILGTLGGTAVITLGSMVWIVREVGLHFCRIRFRSMFAFGAPLIPASLAMSFLQFADRFFLRYYGPAHYRALGVPDVLLASKAMAAVGIYSLAYKLAMALSTFVTGPFLLAWGALVIPITMREDGLEILSRILTYFMLVVVVCGLGLALLGPGIIRIMAAKPFHSAGEVVPVLALGFVVLAASYVLNAGVHISKKTTLRAASVVLAAIGNLVMNVLLIPRYGMLGAAWATTISFGILALASWAASQRVYPIPYDFRRMAALSLIALALYGLGKLVPDRSLWVSMLSGLVLTGLYPVVLYAVGFFTPQELEGARRSLRLIRERRIGLARGRIGVRG